MKNVSFVIHRTVSLLNLRNTGYNFPVSLEMAAMRLYARHLKMAFLSFTSTLLLFAANAYASGSGEFNLTPARPTLGSVDCLHATGILLPACPYEIASPSSMPNITPTEVGTFRVLRLLANERLHERFWFFKPYDPYRQFTLPRGFSAKMLVGYPGAKMDLDFRNLDIDMQLLGGSAAYPFNNDDPYAMMRFSWRW